MVDNRVADTTVHSISTAVDISSKTVDLASKGINVGANAINITSKASNIAIKISSTVLRGTMWVINLLSDILFASIPILIIIGIVVDIILIIAGSSYLIYLGVN